MNFSENPNVFKKKKSTKLGFCQNVNVTKPCAACYSLCFILIPNTRIKFSGDLKSEVSAVDSNAGYSWGKLSKLHFSFFLKTFLSFLPERDTELKRGAGTPGWALPVQSSPVSVRIIMGVHLDPEPFP